MNPQISLFASAARPQYWKRLYDSLLNNTVTWELVFVGPVFPMVPLPANFKFYFSYAKPAQCYEAASRYCRGEIIGWTADDADYEDPKYNCKNSLDSVWQIYQESCQKYGDKKTIVSQRQHEDGGDNWDSHRFFHGDLASPMMAPFGFMNREWYRKLGGYDRNFICGQSENDMVMRGLQDGGRVVMAMDAHIYIHHRECHGEYTFRHGYTTDREFLESCWVNGALSNTRIKQLEPFSDENILKYNQGPAGRWAMETAKA